MPNIVYEGPTSRTDLSTEFHVRGSDGKMYRLVTGHARSVPDDVSKALLSGSDDRFKGHKFREATKEETAELEAVTDPAVTGGGSGGSGGGGGGGTARAGART